MESLCSLKIEIRIIFTFRQKFTIFPKDLSLQTANVCEKAYSQIEPNIFNLRRLSGKLFERNSRRDLFP